MNQVNLARIVAAKRPRILTQPEKGHCTSKNDKEQGRINFIICAGASRSGNAILGNLDFGDSPE
jgi:hypothetical protein